MISYASNAFFFIFIFCNLLSAEIPPHLKALRELQENTLPANTSYRHKDSVVTWKGDDGAKIYQCHTDCSGLVDALLIHTYHFDKESLFVWLGGNKRPRAENYYHRIVEEKGFKRIWSVSDILPGDFIAMKYLPGAGDKGHDTGHILVVNQPPEKISPKSEDLQRYAVQIIDCSKGHGKKDTRYFDDTFHAGIGKGTFALFTNTKGKIEGYSWTTSNRSEFYGSDRRPVAIGRLTKTK